MKGPEGKEIGIWTASKIPGKMKRKSPRNMGKASVSLPNWMEEQRASSVGNGPNAKRPFPHVQSLV
jgi:hypothetical protein